MTDWNEKMQEATDRAEEEVRRLIRYMNDEVVPDVRKHSSTALKTASEQLQALARRLDDHK